MNISASVIIPSYQAPRELDLCLAGLARQSTMPDEILVADDGSDHRTAEIIKGWDSHLNCRLVHVWHEDRGNRKGQICNQAVRESTGNLLLFIDGDSIPHSHWVADHLAASQRADVCCGRRVKLGSKITPTVNKQLIASGGLEKFFGPVSLSALSGDTRRFTLGLRLPKLLARILHPRPRKLMGVNFSLSREAFYAVNGYDEEWSHRCEDKDLDLRLQRSGCKFAALLNRAVVYHLHHPERLPSQATEKRVSQEEDSSRIACRVGVREENLPSEFDGSSDV